MMVTQKSTRAVGLGRVLVAVYALLALAATGRSVFQIAEQFSEAPLAYTLSALSAVVYIVATVALVKRGTTSYAVAWATISFELAGVLIVGLVTALDPALFPDDTVWSFFGRGYGFVPLVLPVLGMLWLARTRPTAAERAGDGGRPSVVDRPE
jgi:cytochrome bd-type quinol oxidase subunit 2